MKITEVPEEYKIYTVRMSDRFETNITGEQKIKLVKTKENFIELPNGTILNKSFITNIVLNIEETRENIQKNKPKMLDIVNTT